MIDLSNVSVPNNEISDQVRCALTNVGFLYIVNHGVDMSKVNFYHSQPANKTLIFHSIGANCLRQKQTIF